MTVRLDNEVIHLEGTCHVEEAETLLALVQGSRVIDLTECHHLHGAVLQVLLTARPRISGRCKDSFIRDWILPSLLAPL